VNVAGVWCVPQMFDEKAVHQRLQDPVKRFQVNVFNASTDIMITAA
jgi:hypothetical protein